MNKREQGDKFSRLESAMVQDNEQFIQSQKKRQEVNDYYYFFLIKLGNFSRTR